MNETESAALRILIGVVRSFEDGATDPDRVCRTVVEQVTTLFGSYGALALVRGQGDAWECVARHAEAPAIFDGIGALLGGPRSSSIEDGTLTARVLRARARVRLDDLSRDAELAQRHPDLGPVSRAHELGPFLGVPIRAHGAILGALVVGRSGAAAQPFTDVETETIEVLASYAAQVLERARFVESEQKLRAALAKSNERLRVASRTEAVGRLVGGIAHDLNNVLSVVLSYSGMLLEDQTDPTVREDLEEMKRAGERGSELVRQMLAFGRHEVTTVGDVDVAALVHRMRPLLKRILFEDVELSVTIDAENATIRADPSHVEQVMLDIVLNARDAMSAGGSIAVLVASDEGPIGKGRDAEARVTISIRCRGGEVRDVDPYFSSSPGSTDFGLGVPRNLVARYGGSLSMRVDTDGAVVFALVFPKKPGTEASPRPLGAVARGNGTVLVVDDDEAVRNLVEDVLGRSGYRVLSASDGSAALELVAIEPVDLLLTDVIMPRMSGYALAARARTIRPTIRVLTMSGYPVDVTRQRGGGSPEKVLAKPLVPAALLSAVRSALEAPVGAPTSRS